MMKECVILPPILRTHFALENSFFDHFKVSDIFCVFRVMCVICAPKLLQSNKVLPCEISASHSGTGETLLTPAPAFVLKKNQE